MKITALLALLASSGVVKSEDAKLQKINIEEMSMYSGKVDVYQFGEGGDGEVQKVVVMGGDASSKSAKSDAESAKAGKSGGKSSKATATTKPSVPTLPADACPSVGAFECAQPMYYIVVQHITDHPEGCIRCDLASAEAAFTAVGSSWFKRLYGPGLTVLQEFGAYQPNWVYCQVDAFAAEAQATGVIPALVAGQPACCFPSNTWPCSS